MIINSFLSYPILSYLINDKIDDALKLSDAIIITRSSFPTSVRGTDIEHSD